MIDKGIRFAPPKLAAKFSLEHEKITIFTDTTLILYLVSMENI